MRKLSIIIPAYNEASTINALLLRVQEADIGTYEKEVIVVDDGSTDATPELLGRWKGKVQVYTLLRNEGKGRAVRTGYAHATGDYVVVQDADLELDPNDLKVLLQKAEEGNVAVFGSRRLPIHGETRKHGTWYFELGGILLTWLTNILYGTRITDEPTCYKMVRRDALQKIPLTANGFDFCPELTAQLARRGIRIVEVPIHYTPRSVAEGKKVRLSDWFWAVWTLVKNRL